MSNHLAIKVWMEGEGGGRQGRKNYRDKIKGQEKMLSRSHWRIGKEIDGRNEISL